MKPTDLFDHDALREKPRTIIRNPGSSRKDPGLTGADPEDDCFATGKTKGKKSSMLSSKGQQLGYRPYNSINESVGSAAWIQASNLKPSRTIRGASGTLGLGRDDSRAGIRADRLSSVLGPPQRLPATPAAKPALQMQVDLSNDPEESNGSPSFGDATKKFLKPGTKEMIINSNNMVMKSIMNDSAGLSSFGATPSQRDVEPAKPSSSESPSFFTKIKSTMTGWLSPQAASAFEVEIDVESGNEEIQIHHILHPPEPAGRPWPINPSSPEPPPSPSKLPTFRIVAMMWGTKTEYFKPAYDSPMEAKISFRYDSTELIIQLVASTRRHCFPIDVNTRLKIFVTGPCEDGETRFIDLYYVKPMEELADAGFDLGDPQLAKCNNVRLFVEVPTSELSKFDILCKKIQCPRYLLEHVEEYQAMRPYSHYDKMEQQMMGLPFAVNRRPARSASSYTRDNIRTSFYNIGTQPKRRSTRPPSGADDDVMIVQPSVPTRGQLMFIYPEDSLDGIHMTTIEYARLQPGVYLNDNNIDFELSRMYYELLSPAQQERTFVYNCFFYKRLTSSTGKEPSLSAYERIQSWTGDVNIFDRDFLVIPINEALHWYAAVIINPGWLIRQRHQPKLEPHIDTEENSQVNLFDPVDLESDSEASDTLERTYVVILDSLFNNRTGTMTRLKNYLVSEARAKLGLDLDPSLIKGFLGKNIPKQDNTYDCGCFLLQYVQEIFEHHDTIRPELVEQRHAWFDASLAKGRRARMAQKMLDIAAEYKERHPDMHAPVDLGNSSDIEEITIDLC